MKEGKDRVHDVRMKILAFFEAVLCDDLTTKALINVAESNITFENGQLIFDLPSLHRIIFKLDEVGYSEFKQILYSSELNKNINKKGALVVVWRPQNIVKMAKVDANLYCLQKNIK